MKEIYLSIALPTGLIRCGTLHTGNDTLDAAYNVSSALIKGSKQSNTVSNVIRKLGKLAVKSEVKAKLLFRVQLKVKSLKWGWY